MDFKSLCGGLGERWTARKASICPVGGLHGPLPKEELQIVHVNNLEPHLGHFSASRVETTTLI